jgi:hypothetical protein
MKLNLIYRSVIALVLLSTSCKKEEETVSETESAAPKEIIMPRVQAIPVQSGVQQPTSQTVTPTQNQIAPQNIQTMSPNQAVTKPGMNPPHGQAGHRCDIAVGAPLNSPLNKPKTLTSNTQPTITSSTITPVQATPAASAPAILNPNQTTTTTVPGMNPPHGQEGHDCAVAVGAPLPKK